MELLKNNKILFSVSVLYIILNSILLYCEIFYGVLIPFMLLIVWFAIVKLDLLLLTVVFFTPLSVLLSEFIGNSPVDLSIPTEPILAALLMICILKISLGQSIEKKILKHPISIAVYINLFWIFFTSISSTMPMVSMKFFLARVWFVIPLFFMAAHFFKDPAYIKKYLWAYIIPFVIIILYTLANHISVGLFVKKAAHGVVKPFYNDHTSYGAILAMFIPVLCGFLFLKRYKGSKRIFISGLLSLFIFAVIFSYTRAAWISVLAATGVLTVILLKINGKILLAGSITIVALFIIFQFEITDSLNKNRQDSSEDLGEHISSISNIATDASNMERINRWNSAICMFKERPVLGFGPGTYMFQYAPYQMSYDRTIISTNFGDVGNAHSEYIGPMAESGILGVLTFLGIIIVTIITGIRVYYKTQIRELKIISLISLLGLITYYIHGFLNNFLDTDKASVPFWGFTAIIVAIDVFHQSSQTQKNLSGTQKI